MIKNPTTDMTACLALNDGTLFFGKGFGAEGVTVRELCFNTAMIGYQEARMTDPSYAGQHCDFYISAVLRNVGSDLEDDEAINPVAEGIGCEKWDVTDLL